MIFLTIAALTFFAAILVGLTVLRRRSRRLWEEIAERVPVSISDRRAENHVCIAGLRNADTVTLTLLRKYRVCVAIMLLLTGFFFGLLIGNIILVAGLGLAYFLLMRWKLDPLDMTVETFR